MTSDDAACCVGVLGYVYDHETRALSQRLASTFHAHHGLSVASMHVHLNHGSCLEVAVMTGPPADIRSVADSITAQRGVRHANLHLVPGPAAEAEISHTVGKKAHVHA